MKQHNIWHTHLLHHAVKKHRATDCKCEVFLLLLLLGQIPKVPCLAINLAIETPTPGCPQAAMKGALKGETKTNTALEREQTKNGMGDSAI